MFKIVRKEELAENIKLMEIDAPSIAKKAKPGQFIIFRSHDKGERIPLTIADFDRKRGTITIVFQEVGKTTEELGTFNEGDSILDFVGPLGKPSDHDRKEEGKVICIAGGVGTAVIFTELRNIKEHGNYTITIQGSRCKSLLFWTDRMKHFSNEYIITTDDGSLGIKGFVSPPLEDSLKKQAENITYILAIGPVPMMAACVKVAKNYNVKAYVSLNTIMVDGTGMCGSCRITVGDKSMFACVDGPEFDGWYVDWKELAQRNNRYLPAERQSLERYKELVKGKNR